MTKLSHEVVVDELVQAIQNASTDYQNAVDIEYTKAHYGGRISALATVLSKIIPADARKAALTRLRGFLKTTEACGVGNLSMKKLIKDLAAKSTVSE
jgi:hypothetical protein